MIYLDNSATTYPKPEALYEALDFANRNLAFNAGRGAYPESLKALNILNEAREAVGSLYGLSGSEVAFLSSATEALNLLILGLNLNDGDCVYISPFEHNAIVRPLYNLQKRKAIEILVLPFDRKYWKPDEIKMEEMFSFKKPKAIFLSQLSNVTGLLLDYKTIFKMGKKYGAYTILDSAQAYGIAPIDFHDVDYCVFAGHKSLYGPFGIAGIVSKKFSELDVVKSGGNGSDSLNHEMPSRGPEHLESGSPNVVAAYGLTASINWLKKTDALNKEKQLTSYLITSLKSVPNIVIYLPDNTDNILGIVSFNINGYEASDVASILSGEFNICVRSGYHCSPFVHDFIDSLAYKGTIRVSLGAFNNQDDIDQLIAALKTL